MDGALEELKGWVRGLVRKKAQPPIWLRIPSDEAPEAPLVSGEDYFQVRVRRVQLAYEREWFETYAPMLVVASEFSYGGEEVTCPAVIGPSLVEKHGGSAAPVGTTIANTVVAGPHPVRPGGLGLTVSLHRVARGNVAEGLLNVLEATTMALDLAAGFSPYTTLAKVVVSGVTTLSGGDAALVARRDQFTSIEPGDYALLSPGVDASVDRLVVVDDELHERTAGMTHPVRGINYVLYSLERVPTEGVDVTHLPLHQQWLRALAEANRASNDEIWTSAKTQLSTLVNQAFTSPDLTWQHAELLEQQWLDLALKRKQAAEKLGQMGGEAPGQEARARALSVLEL